MIRARLNGKGDIAAPGAAQIAGRNLVLRKATTLELDATGFLGGEVFASVGIDLSGGLTLRASSGVEGAKVWPLYFEGQGSAALSFMTPSGRVWSGQVRVRNDG